MTAEQQTSRLSFFGRVTDELTRRVLSPSEIAVAVEEAPRRRTEYKDDGHFAIADLPPSATDYHLRISGTGYQTRTVAKALPTTTAVQVTFDGEDELYLNLVAAPTPQHRVTFEALPFIPTIATGAAVIGQGGFTATLAEALEGRNVTTAVLSGSAGLVSGQLLRVRRGASLRLRRAPFFTFPADVTVVALHVVENVPAEPPIEGALVTLTQVNGSPALTVAAGSLTLRRFSLAGTSRLIVDDGMRLAVTDSRGDAVLVFPGEKAVTSVTLAVTRPQFIAATTTVAVTVKTRNFQKVPLTHI